MNKPRIIAVHLLNDFSGSPFVFSQALAALKHEGYEMHLFTSTPAGNGFLSKLSVIHHNVFYRWSNNKVLTLFYFLASQLSVFCKIFILVSKNDLVYINTMLPFGAAIAARIKGCKVVYHIHEVSVKPAILKKFLLVVINHTADHCIYVSEYVKKYTGVKISSTVIYNALPFSFTQKAIEEGIKQPGPFTILMLCSLKIYKGVFEFIECAKLMPGLHFELVLNTSQEEMESFFKDVIVPQNLIIFPAQQNVHPFYKRSSIVMNLSLPDKWIETFGMTALEAMYYKKPVIVPPIGGIMELVENGVSGYCINAANVQEIINKLQKLSQNNKLYKQMSEAAYLRAGNFTQQSFSKNITGIIKLLTTSTIQQKNIPMDILMIKPNV